MRVRDVRKKAAAVIKKGTAKFREAEKRGAVEKWNKRLSLGMKAVEAAVLVTAVVRGARINGKRRSASRRRTSSRVRSK